MALTDLQKASFRDHVHTTDQLIDPDTGDVADVGGGSGYAPGGTDVAVADGGTGASTASGARTNLGLAVGTDVEAHDSDLTTIAGLSPTNDDILQRKSGAWANRTIAQLASDLGLAAGYQPLDSDLTAIAALSTTSTGRSLLAAANAAAIRSIAAAIGDTDPFTYLDATDGSAPANPSAGKARIYSKSGRIYSRDSSGVEYGPFDVAGGGAGLYFDTLTHGSKYDDFTNVAGWTAMSGGAPSNAAVTNDIYDTKCQDLTFSAAGKGLYKSWSGDGTAYLSIHGITNTTPDSAAALGGMIALCFLDSSNNGVGVSLYNDNGFYHWITTAGVYAGSGNGTGAVRFMDAQAASWPIVYRLVKSGTTYTGSVSFNGGVTWKTPTAQTGVSGTTDKVAIVRLFSGGGTNPVLRVGTFNNA